MFVNVPQKYEPLKPDEITLKPPSLGLQVSPIMPIPSGAGGSDIMFGGRLPDEEYWFRDVNGQSLFGELRWNLPGQQKRVRPVVFTAQGWHQAAPPPPRPFFNLDKLAASPSAPVYLFEGPRKAQKAAICFPGAVCSSFLGGAGAVKQTDFSPLTGRDVILWRDAGQTGLTWQNSVVASLRLAGAASIRIIDPYRLSADIREQVPESKRSKLDVVDLVEVGIPAQEICDVAQLASVLMSTHDDEGPLPLTSPREPPNPYPVDALGGVLAGAAQAIAVKVQCSVAMAAQSILAVASLAAQAHADVWLPYGQTRPLSLFVLTIAASGDRKTTSDREAMRPVKLREAELREAYAPLEKKHVIDLAAWQGQKQQILRKKAEFSVRRADLEALGPEPTAPIKPCLTLGESTAEGLAKHMPTLPGALGIFNAEGGQFLNGHGFTPEAKLRTASSFASLWDGEGLRRLRAGDGLIDLHGRRLACHLMVQPEAAAGVLADPVLRDQGLLSRLLVAAPESLAGQRLWREPSPETDPALEQYEERILTLLRLPANTSNVACNELNPRPLHLAPSARKLWIKFHDAVEVGMRPAGPLAIIRDVAAKAAEQAGRIAGVLQMVFEPRSANIGEDAMGRACELMTWYLNEALRSADAATDSSVRRNAKKLLEWLRDRDLREVTAAELEKNGPGPLRQKVTLDPALRELEKLGWLIPTDASRRAWRVERPAS